MRKKTSTDVHIDKIETIYEGHNALKKYSLKINYFDGTLSDNFYRECNIKPTVAGILPYDVQRDKLVLIEQFRIGALADEVSPWLFEIVAGIVDKKGEKLEDMALRELCEETGIESKNLSFISKYWVSPGASSERLSLYWSDVDSTKAKKFCGIRSEFEDIKVHILSATEAFAMLDAGLICNSLTIIALQWLRLNKNNLKQKA